MSGRRGPIFYGWWIVIASIGLQVVGAGLMSQAYGAYVVVLRAEFGWSTTMLSLASSLSRLESGVLGPPQGWLIDRFGPRLVVLGGVFIFGAGLALLSLVDTEISFILVYMMLSI